MLAPADQRDARHAARVDDAQGLAPSQPHRIVPARRDLLAADDGLRCDRRAIERGRRWQGFRCRLLSRHPKFLVAAAVGCGNLRLRPSDHLMPHDLMALMSISTTPPRASAVTPTVVRAGRRSAGK